jgi:hypothetical protein
MTTKEHNWTRTTNFDRLERDAFYCPECAALCLTSETEYKSLLDQKGCCESNLYDDFYNIKYIVNGVLLPLSFSMTVNGSWELASLYICKGYSNVSVFNSVDIEVDFEPYLQ